MANPQPTPFIRLSQEVSHALTLFGRLSAAEWEIMHTLMAYTWGQQRKRARIGLAEFDARTFKSLRAVKLGLKRLTKPPAEGGWGVVRVVEEHNAQQAKVYEIVKDWELWAWKDDHLDRARKLLAPYAEQQEKIEARRRKAREKDNREIPAQAIELASHLWDHCSSGNDAPDLPPRQPDSPRWIRWCEAMAELMDRQQPAAILTALEWAHGDDFWSAQIRGQNADRVFCRNFDKLHAAAQTRNRRRL